LVENALLALYGLLDALGHVPLLVWVLALGFGYLGERLNAQTRAAAGRHAALVDALQELTTALEPRDDDDSF
jgi:hypothetical protein